jgi:hypothetical protein
MFILAFPIGFLLDSLIELPGLVMGLVIMVFLLPLGAHWEHDRRLG